ncbi:MAG: DUF2062 domain-containing protein [Thermoanaerobaculaceae bacterium]
MSWKKAKARLTAMLGAGDDAHRIALSWAVGVSIGFSPILGLHTVLALLLAFLLRLNKLDVLLGTMVINPWTLPAYWLAATTLGGIILGQPPHAFGSHLIPKDLFTAAAALRRGGWLWQVVVGWFVGASVFAAVAGASTYFGLRWLLGSHRRHALAKPPRET